MIHTASCSTSHRVGDRGTESVTVREVCTGDVEAAEIPRTKAGLSCGFHRKGAGMSVMI